MNPLADGEMVFDECPDCAVAGPRPQTVVLDFPPLYGEITQAFPSVLARRDVVFSFGPVVFNPHDVHIPPEILLHESVHGARQGEQQEIWDWWRRYIEDPVFRLREEADAHRAEYQWVVQHGGRQQRRAALKHIASKLASPLYGRMVTPSRARSMLKAP